MALELTLKRFEIQIFEAILVPSDLEEADLKAQLQYNSLSQSYKAAANHRLFELGIEREIIVCRLADFDLPLRVLVG